MPDNSWVGFILIGVVLTWLVMIPMPDEYAVADTDSKCNCILDDDT